MDLQGFYDAIRPTDVVGAIKRICNALDAPHCPEFDKALDQMFKWQWKELDEEQKGLLKKLPMGIPQGLVASGFYSNAYMHQFDQAITNEIQSDKAVTQKGLRIIDYCRYVDDIRLIVETSVDTANKAVVEDVCKWVKKKIMAYLPTQTYNDSKTNYISLEDLESRTMRPTIMEAIQDKLSGPMDLESLNEVSIAIDGLLNTVIAEKDASKSNKKASTSKKGSNGVVELPLARIHVVKHLVRDDTVIRFSSYRQFKTLRSRRFYLAAESSDKNSHELERIDAEIELACRQMIRMWSTDPSLAIVLRHAMNLFPTPILLSPVLDALQTAIQPEAEQRLKKPVSPQHKIFRRSVGLYSAGELLKAGIIETGIDVSPEELPAKSDLLGYRELLGDFAEMLLDQEFTPWYVSQQAVMFLLMLGRTPD